MGNRKARRLIAFVMSAIMMCSMLLTNGIVSRAESQFNQVEPGTMHFTCQSNAVTGGNILYKLDGDTEFQTVNTENGYADIDVSASQTITLKFAASEGYNFDEQRGVMIRVDGAMEYSANRDAAKPFVATDENDDGVTIDLSALIHDPEKSVATASFEVEFGFGKPNDGQQGENNPQRPEINQGDVLFCIQNAQNGENSKVYVSATGEDGSWVEVKNYDVIPADDIEGLEAFWVKYELVEGQKLDDYVDNGMSVNRYRVDDEEQALVFNKDNIAEVPYSPDKKLEITIRFMNDNNGSGPSANPGDVVVHVNNGQSGRVYLSKNGVDGWENVGNNQVVAKTFFEGTDKIYVRYELNEGQILDDYIDKNSGISVNCYRVDGTAIALDFGDSDIAEVPYSADKNLEINISFMGGGDNPPGPDIHVEPGDVLFKIRNISNGDVFVSTTKPEDINEWRRLTDENSVVTADFFEGVSEFYVMYMEHQNQELDDYVDEQTGISANCYRVEGVATNLEFVEKIATIPYDSEHAIEVELGFKGNGGGPGAGASKDYEYAGEATSSIKLNCNYDVDGAGKVSTPMYYINGAPAFDMLYDAEMNQEEVAHFDVVTYPYDAEDENTPVVDGKKAVEFEFVNAINQRYTDIWINGVDYSGMIPGMNPENRTWEILDAMSLNGQSQDMSFILQVPYADEYVIDAHVSILGEDNQFFGPFGSPLAFNIHNASNGTVGYAYGDPAQPGETREYDYDDLNNRFGDDFDWEVERTPEEWEALELSFFPEAIESGKELVLYARPTEEHELNFVQVRVNGEDFTHLIDMDVLREDGFWIFDTTEFGECEVVEFEIEFSKTEEEELEDASFFPTGNFLWSNLDIDKETDMFLDNTIVEFVKFTYKDRDGQTIVIDNFEDMNTESYLSFSENPNKGEATLIGGGEITVHLIPRYGYQVVEFGPNGMPCVPDSDEIATYTFTVRNGNAHIGAICAPVEDTVATDAAGISEGSIALDVEGDTNFEVGTAVLEVKDTEATSEEQEAFAEAAEGYTVDSYLDLNLNNVVYKGTSEDVWATPVEELANPATITLTVDDEIDSDIEIIHQKHDGTYEVIPATYDAEKKTVTFETDSFSKYAIAKKSDVPALEKVEAKEATCTEAGNIEYYVDGEGVYYKDAEGKEVVTEVTIPAAGHKEETIEAVDATCAKPGLTEGKKCSVCGEILVEQEVTEKIAHTEEPIAAVDATCSKTGLTEGKKCSVCGEITVAQTEVAKLAHTEETIEAVAPTCAKTGLTEGKKCSVCGEITVAQTEVEKVAHTEETIEAVAPTCAKTGLTEGKKCSVCGEITVAQTEVEKVAHTEVVDEGKEATATEPGLTEGKHCSVCGEILVAQEEIPVIVIKNGWVQNEDESWGYYQDGAPVTGWNKISNKWYYMDEEGIMQTGWMKISDKWYYFERSGVMVAGWKKISNVWYYFETSGAMTTGWKKISNVWYYFETSGAMATGWKKISNVWYYFDGGAMATGWKKISDVWYYFDGGAMATGWKQIGNVWYYFDGGAMVEGWKLISGKWYYFLDGGAMATGWKYLGGKWHYFDGGAMVEGWKLISGKWYYFLDGVMVTGKVKIDGKTYTFDSNGVMK